MQNCIVKSIPTLILTSCLTKHYAQYPPDGPGSAHHEPFCGYLDNGDIAAIKQFAQSSSAELSKLKNFGPAGFVGECAPWIECAKAFCAAATAAADCVNAGRPEDAIGILSDYLKEPLDVMKYETQRFKKFCTENILYAKN
ncbi:MAG: hypothetical protein FWH01_11795 [Oscillospiraceae bacterium]|nr:hypothetical protein [Oscillospiraceae bacterium]